MEHEIKPKLTLVPGGSASSSVAPTALAVKERPRTEVVDIGPEAWLKDFMARYRIEYDYKTDSLRQDGEPLEHAIALSKMRLSANRSGDKEVRSFLNDALLLWKRAQATAFLDGLRARLAYHSCEQDLVAEWVLAATGKRSALDVAVMRHFVWQVKRKLNRLPVEHHMMVVLYGRSGGGKSMAVHKLIEPLRDVALCRDMGVFGDQFGRRQFARAFIMFFDELSKCSTVDVNAMKNIITSPVVEWRSMKSEGISSSPQNATFIGCSNDPVADRISDPTSGRRFWQLNCADKLDWDRINAIDYSVLWRSVDETGPCPITTVLAGIQEIQNREIRGRDLIEQWLEAECRPASFHPDSPSTSELFHQFRGWCERHGISTFPGSQRFARCLGPRVAMLGWDAASKHTSKGTAWSIDSSTGL